MTGYTDGRRMEYLVRDDLKAKGFEVIRSAGSKGAVDLVAFHGTDGNWPELMFVQVKRGNKPTLPPAERAELLRLAVIAWAIPVVAYQPKPRKPVAYRQLTGPGPRDWQPWTPGGDT